MQLPSNSTSYASILFRFLPPASKRSTRAHIFPVTTLVTPGDPRDSGIWFSIRVLPLSAETSVLSYDVYGEPETSRDDVETLKRMAKNTLEKLEARHEQLCAKDKGTLTGARLRHIPRGPSRAGGIDDRHNNANEKIKQAQLLSMLQSHLRKEKEMGGTKILPAFAGKQYMGQKGIEADMVCKELDRCTASRESTLFEW
ncbi:hypothetical protein HOY80DRAFT_207557 [Tuber brumale]|nr:hypothetical protein HOY80DRAFT_207557 [Tuber brumale]